MTPDGITHWLQVLIHAATDAPDLIAVLIGTLGAFCLGLLAEAYFIPESVPRRQQQGLTILITLLASVVISDLLWAGLDPADKASVRLAGSFAGGCFAPFLYPLLAKLVAKVPVLGPAVSSIWALPH